MLKKSKEWKLAIPNMTIWDKLKIGYWLLTEDQWTQGKFVRDYEKRWENYTGCPHVIMVANGSVANELIALRRKTELQKAGDWPHRNKVIFNSINWISSISVWINFGFEPIFVDVGSNICPTAQSIENAIGYRRDVAAVFYTSLLGFSGGVQKIETVCIQNKIPLYLDNCEASFSTEQFCFESGLESMYKSLHISNVTTSSTSLYFSHHTSGQNESGLIFCQTDEENEWYRMARNHGMTRGMPEKYKNPAVDPAFDFCIMGSNYRSTNLNAYMCSLDLDRALAFSEERRVLSILLTRSLNPDKFDTPHKFLGGAIPLALPIVAKTPELIAKVKTYLAQNRIEFRPLVSGNILYQTAFKQYGDPKDFPRADYFHHNGIYIGLHKKVTRKMVEELAEALNKL